MRVDITPRACRVGEVAAVAAAATAIFRAPPRSGDMAAEYPLLFDEEHADRLRVIERGGVILSHAGFWLGEAVLGPAGRARIACFGAVFTRPGQEGRGLGSAALADAVATARAMGAQVGLISGQRSLYERLGFSPMPPAIGYAPGPGPCLGTWSQADPGDVARLYDAEAVRFVRSPRDWHRLLAAGTVFYGPGTVRQLDRAAYVAVDAASRVLEFAGDREALAAALPGLGIVEVIAPAHDHALAAVARGWQRRAVPFPFGAARWDPSFFDAPLPFYGLNYM